ncbi:MAG: hypothetical protein HY818_00295 [Acetobacterium woodii]|nr:hypothetical protein [Acetobacterium woodii]
MKKILTVLLICCALFPVHSVLAASADTTILPVLSRGHIQDLGDYPADGSWVESPNRIGTVGQSKRIEGFELKAADSLPADVELRYNVHVQNIGWLYDENDPSSWAKNGDYAGTRGDSLRIEAIKIVLLDASGTKASGYHIRYQGHVQNIGDLPADSEQWFVDGEQLGTVGSSLRLEALKLEIIKDAATDPGLNAYTTLIKKINSLNESDYSKASWLNLQTVLKNHVVTDKNTAEEVAAAVKTINAAMQQLENLSTITDYHKPGTYGPNSGSETINQDVIITSTGVTLQNLTIDGNLIIDEAVGDGEVTLNNVNVTGELRVRGGGKNSIHINGGAYSKIMVEQTPDGGVRIVASGLDGVPVVLSENAAGETLILEGSFESVTVNAPDVVIKTQGQTSIKSFDVAKAAQNAAIDLGPTTTVTNLALSSPTKVTGTGTVSKAEIASDNVSFEKAPQDYTVEPGVVVPPVIPKPTPQPQPGGGSGGGYTPPSKINLSVTTAPSVTLSKAYDGNAATDVTNQVLDPAAIAGVVAGDTVVVNATATYNNKNVGSDKIITITYTLSGTNADKYNPPTATTVKGEIVKKTLSLPATPSVSKEFDGTATLDTVINEDLGQVSSDNLTITRTTTYQNNAGKTDAIEVGSGKTVACTYSLSGTDASNYTAPADQLGTGTITKRTLSVSNASLNINKTKSYDGTTAVKNINGDNVSNMPINVATGVVGDTNIIVSATAAYDDQNASSSKIITVNYAISGTNANSRYQVTSTETINGASISPCQLTIPVSDVPQPLAKAYDGTADVFTAGNNTDKIYNKPVTPGNIATADTGKVTVKATATYDAGKDVGIGKKTTIHYVLSGDAASNYLVPPDDQSKSADITPLTITVGTLTNKTKEYDGTSTAKPASDLSCSDNIVLFKSEAGTSLLYKIDAKYYTDSACQTETSKPNEAGTELYIKYTISLEGASASNYVFAGGNPTFAATSSNGSITAKKLTVSAAALGLQTDKTYDGSTSASSTLTTITGNNGLTGIVGTDKVIATATSYYDGVNAGDHNITTSFSLSGDDKGNYCITDLTSSGKIKPIQLAVDNTKLPTIAATRKYDATTAVYLADNTTKLSDYVLSADAVSGLINSETVTVKATASYNDKNAGEDKPITITYSLPEGTNYLAPVADTSKSATITPRTLGYSNVKLETMKKADGNSTVTIKGASIDPTKASGDGVVPHAGTVTLEDVSLGSYRADYYTADLKDTTSATGSHPIKITGTLTGNDATGAAAGNYVLADDITPGQILDVHAVISTPYASTNWSVASTLTAPADNFKLFYAKQAGTTTFFGYDSTGQIYSSTDLSTWTTGAKVTLGDKQLIGIDSNSYPLAIATTPDTDGYGNTSYPIYSWSYGGWTSNNSLTNIQPSNPTYYTDSNNDYLIYQDENNDVIKQVFSTYTPETIGAYAGPFIPSSFKSSLLVYNGTTLTVYAY